jgi:hypothetical protein
LPKDVKLGEREHSQSGSSDRNTSLQSHAKTREPTPQTTHVNLPSENEPIKKRGTLAGVLVCFSRLRLPMSFLGITRMR